MQSSSGGKLFHLADVYGLHTIANRRPLWVELFNFVSASQGPCIMIGDYNVVYITHDRLNGNAVN